MNRSGLIALGIFTAYVLTGCAVGPNYHRPALDTPGSFRGSTLLATNSLADLSWWNLFKDETLQKLIRIALTNNYDLRMAISRVEQARALVMQRRAEFFPQLNYGGSVSRGKNAVAGNPVYANGGRTDNFLAVGQASWELDLWGRIRRLNESARAQYLASQEGRRDVTISLISMIAQNYFQLLALDRQLEIAHESTNSFGESLRIFRLRQQGGTVSKLETSSAQAALSSSEATVPQLERQIFLQENLINVLLGLNPGTVPRTHPLSDQHLDISVPVGLPSALLERRPDIREAEQMLRSANAQVGVAVANFFPNFSLTGLFGQVSPEASAFTSGGANAWSMAANVSGPLFHGGALRGQYLQAKAQRDQAELQYKSSVLSAIQEVSNALVSHQKYAEESLYQANAVAAYQDAVHYANERYKAGRSAYYELLQEQQLLFPAENAFVQAELNQLLAIVQLYRALGGGWEAESKTASASSGTSHP